MPVNSVSSMRKVVILVAALAVPAAAYAMKAAPKQPLCFASGASTYQIVASATAPDYRIRIDAEAARPDLRMQLVDRAENADFVLVDDFSGNEPSTCKSATPIRTVTLDAAAGTPDVTVHLSADAKGADYRLYVHSARFSQRDAAALLAAMWKADQSRQVAWSSGRPDPALKR
ncbi:MAG: hypothetical protein K2Z80_09785 [Xanthobacteraceae bacterium]|nr:hypothetical protein [Xanthobacteraceae bacterium]